MAGRESRIYAGLGRGGEWARVGAGLRDCGAFGEGGLVRDYVILDCLVRHICNSLMESVYNHVIAELKPGERVENHVIAECAALQEYKIT